MVKYTAPLVVADRYNAHCCPASPGRPSFLDETPMLQTPVMDLHQGSNEFNPLRTKPITAAMKQDQKHIEGSVYDPHTGTTKVRFFLLCCGKGSGSEMAVAVAAVGHVSREGEIDETLINTHMGKFRFCVLYK